MGNAFTLKDCLKKLRHKEIVSYDEIPEKYHENKEIIKLTRRLGLRKNDKCGYDIISNTFFVEEFIIKSIEKNIVNETKISKNFNDFKSYYEFLNGDIYENACYYGFDFEKEVVNEFQLDTNKLNMVSMLKDRADDLIPELTQSEKENYENEEKKLRFRKEWIKKFNACKTFDELYAVVEKHNKSKDPTNTLFYFWNYINFHGENAFEVIMQYVCNGVYPSYLIEKALIFVYGIERVSQAYKYVGNSPSSNSNHNRKFKQYVKKVETVGVKTKIKKYYSANARVFCIENNIYFQDDSEMEPIAQLYRYFEKFDDFAEFLGNDLSDCDLSQAYSLNIDVSKYKTNDFTKLPVNGSCDLERKVIKRYVLNWDCFEVIIRWYDKNSSLAFERKKSFKYFFDFIAFLNYDLSDADLLFCDGLKNIKDFSKIKWENAVLQSSIEQKIGLKSNSCDCLKNDIQTFTFNAQEECEMGDKLESKRLELCKYENDEKSRKIYYITDLHLMHKLIKANCVTYNDCRYYLTNLVNKLINGIPQEEIYGALYSEEHSKEIIVLIGGDVSSNFEIYKLFTEILGGILKKIPLKIVFTLGNHELWDFEGEELEKIVDRYKKLLSSNGMFLLHNEALFFDEKSNMQSIPQSELTCLSAAEIRDKMRSAHITLFGGIGFSKYNNTFNANNGIYQSVVSKRRRGSEGDTFELLYDKVCACLSDKNVVICTHTPFSDWANDRNHQENFVFVSGHNHKNEFYDDGGKRIYADNQVGYFSKSFGFKYFYLDTTYDWFSEYSDGIYQISREDYINFYLGKNMRITYSRDIHKLFMLKKNNYYCFIHQNRSGGLTMLNGGSMKKLSSRDIQFYYDNMDAEIAFLEKPLHAFEEIQNRVSKAIKGLGGSGFIHGAIVDIDYYNHVYINPYDLKITPYFAFDIINKYVYSSIPALLKAECPQLYSNYKVALKKKSDSLMAIKPIESNIDTKRERYPSTDIYSVSREIKKMQKLKAKVLSVWYENPNFNSIDEKLLND